MPSEIDVPADSFINYNDAVKYWGSIPATVDGVLGGFGNTSLPKVDIIGSNAFLKRLDWHPTGPKIGLDVGAGIGRITLNFLSKVCDQVDLVEPVSSFCAEAHVQLADLKSQGKIGTIFEVGMQDFEPENARYALIWCQWCLGHLPDKELVLFLKRCIKGLQPGGYIIAKENNTSAVDDFDDTDSSVTRTDEKFRELFKEAGLELVLTSLQKGLPKNIYPVRMYALKPRGPSTT